MNYGAKKEITTRHNPSASIIMSKIYVMEDEKCIRMNKADREVGTHKLKNLSKERDFGILKNENKGKGELMKT